MYFKHHEGEDELSIRAETDVGLEGFTHSPSIFGANAPQMTARRMRSKERDRHLPPPTVVGYLRGRFFGSAQTKSRMMGVTILSARRLQLTVLLYLTIAVGLTVLYYFIPAFPVIYADFISGIKDFVDLCITGIVFLLGGYVTLMFGRWWAMRTSGCGALHQALSNINMYAASAWPSGSEVDQQAKAFVARLSLATYQLLFIEARGSEFSARSEKEDGVGAAVKRLVNSGTLLPEEAEMLADLPCRPQVVLGWLALFWEEMIGRKSTLACADAFRSAPVPVQNGRFSVIFGHLKAARDAISMCNFHMSTQLPYGYVNLIQVIVQVTCLANSVYCGIHLGQTMSEAVSPQVWAPLIFIRLIRVCMVPLLLDGLLVVGRVVALPLGEDEDDFRAGAQLEALEDELLATASAAEQFYPSFATNFIQKQE
jgi:hypothetical protein